MKITFITPVPNLSGGIRVIAIYAERLKARGHDVTIVAARVNPPGRKARIKTLVKSLAQGRLPKTVSGRSHFDGITADVTWFAYPGAATDADVPDGDVVIATWWETAFAVARLAPSKGRKIYFVQGYEVHDVLPAHITSGSYHLPLRKVTIAGWLADVMRDTYGDHDVDIVPNSVDHAQFHAPERARNTVPAIGLMYSTGSFKGVDVSLKAIEIARRAVPDLQVISFGTSRPDPALPLPAGSRFFHNPGQQDLRDIYALCDVFLVGSRSEGFALPILEAMACRCPVVSTRTGCAADVIENGVSGFVEDIDDAQALGARIVDVLGRDAAGWRAMSDAALRRVSGYSWDDATALFEQALMRD